MPLQDGKLPANRHFVIKGLGVQVPRRALTDRRICHCTRCQRWTGSSLAGVVVAEENFTFTKGEDLVTRYESEFAPRNFCSKCGSSLYDDLGGKYFVAAGLMRDLDMDPAFHLQVAYKASWHQDRRRRAPVRRESPRLTDV
jgi:hypothetical protein